jgi:hypothetical protein
LRPGGIDILMFPLVEGWEETHEDSAIVSPQDRLLHFGQHDHARYYGTDVRHRITSVGFSLDEFTAVEPYVHRYGLIRGQKVFIAAR